MQEYKVKVELEFFICSSDDEDEATKFALNCLDIDTENKLDMEKVKFIELDRW